MVSYIPMNPRQLIHALTITVAIGLLVTAFASRSEVQSQSVANPTPLVCKQFAQDYMDDMKNKKEAQSQQQLSQQELAERSTQLLQQQRRVARLQPRSLRAAMASR